MSERVSVVLTSYNQKAYLAQAIDSVLGQSRPVHELIVVDDGSSDGSRELLAAAAARDPGRVIPLLRDHDGSIPRTRTAGLARATGELVAVLDGDDLWLPGFVETLAPRLRESATGCAYSNVEFVDAEGRVLQPRDAVPQPAGNVLPHVAAGAMGLLRSLLVRRALVAQAGYLDAAFPKYDGFVLTLRLARLTRFAYVFEPQARYRVHAGGDSRTFGPRAHLRYLEDVRAEVERVLPELAPADAAAVRHAWWWRCLVHGVDADRDEGGWPASLPRVLAAAATHPASLAAIARLFRRGGGTVRGATPRPRREG